MDFNLNLDKFDWNTFGANFLNEITTGIQTKTEEAKEYEESQKKAAESNQRLRRQRTAAANQAAQYGKQALEIMTDDPRAMQIVQNVMASGPNAIATFYQRLEEHRKLTRTDKLSMSDVEAIADISDIDALPDADMSLVDYALETYGAKAPEIAEQEDKTSFVGKMFGFGARERAERRLAEDMRYGDMSIAEINMLASMEDYQAIPGFESAFITYKDAPVFNAEKVIDFKKDVRDSLKDYLTKERVELQNIEIEDMMKTVNRETGKNYTEEEARSVVEANMYEEVVAPIIELYQDAYKESFIYNSRVQQTIKDLMGEDYYNDLIEANKIKEDIMKGKETEITDTQMEDILSPTMGELEGVVPEEAKEPSEVTAKTAPPSVDARPIGRTKIKEKRDWDEKYKGKYNIDGTPIIVNARPDKSLPAVVPKGAKSGLRRKTPYEDWMSKYGETHDPDTGLPLPVEEETAIDTSVVGPYDVTGSVKATLQQEGSQISQMDMYNYPVEDTYLIKIKGKLGTFRVKGEDLSAIPANQIGTNVTIMQDTDTEKDYKEKSKSALERDFK